MRGKRCVLAGDIGGTHARLAVFQEEKGRPRLLAETVFPSQQYQGLEPIVVEYLRTLDSDVGVGCLGVACPIDEGICHLTNLGWDLRTEGFGERVGLKKVKIINDFEAVGYGVPVLNEDQVAVLQGGTPHEDGPVALIGAGTGLGQAFLLWSDGKYSVHPSEGGHADFAPAETTQWEFLRYLGRRYGHVSWERVVSGQGLVEAYRFLSEIGRVPEGEEVRRELEEGESDAAEVISRHALGGADPLSGEAMNTFLYAFGAQAGNLALTVRATGGVYIGGGIAPKILPFLKAGPFLEAFRRKGRLSEFLHDVPVRVIVDDRAGLLGAAVVAGRL